MTEDSQALLRRAQRLAGHTLDELAAQLGVPLPPDLRRHKGWVGRLVERLLGADGGNAPGPDFAALGIELKTLPVDRHGRPRESTFVCSVALDRLADMPFEDSGVHRKLRHVLWLPVEADAGVPLPDRRLGSPLLWRPSAAEWQVLEADWEELSGRLALGEAESLTARDGRYLQVRPKAAHGSDRRTARDAEGAPLRVQPKGFYLRARFTAQLLAAAFGSGGAARPSPSQPAAGLPGSAQGRGRFSTVT